MIQTVTTPNTLQALAMNEIANDNTILGNSTVHLFTTPVAITPATTLAAFTEASFQGYAAVSGQTPGSSYTDPAGRQHVTFPSVLFESVNGFQQTGTVSLTGPVTTSGTLTVTVTAAGMTGSPRAVTVNVLVGDSNSDLAEKVSDALNADADFAPFFTATWSSNVVTVKARTPAAQDSTMNVAVALGTAVGVTPVATWTQTQAGAAPITISQAVNGFYLTDSTNTVYRGGGSFSSPFNFSAPGQGLPVQADVLWGS